MNSYINIAIESTIGAFQYTLKSIVDPGMERNYFYLLLFISMGCWALEIIFPWRKNQGKFRKDFWLDAFYMFFNLFLLYIVGYAAISNVAVELFDNLLLKVGIENMVAISISKSPEWIQYLIMFVVADFIHWNVHRLLHKYPLLWNFHKVHHSVTEMGFAAHLRFHWMESVIYKTLQYIPLALIGFGLEHFFLMHIVTISIGHLNHSNLNLSYGPLKYVLNNPKMHIWHHAKKIPTGSKGVNYGISLSLWDYIFGTAYIPKDGKDIELGFTDDIDFPTTFTQQIKHPFTSKKKNREG